MKVAPKRCDQGRSPVQASHQLHHTVSMSVGYRPSSVVVGPGLTHTSISRRAAGQCLSKDHCDVHCECLLVTSSSNRGLVVEFSPATRETRVRFSAVAFLSVAAPTVPSRRPFSAVAFLPAAVLPLRLRHLVVRSQRLHIFARLFFWLREFRAVFGTCVSTVLSSD